MKTNQTNTSTGLELSLLFVGEDGTLSCRTSEHEVEIIGGLSTIFGDGWSCKIK